MASLSLNKRQQARNERALQSLLRDVPGNNVCADCGAREPGWASYSLGIFLCVRCASCHRALGTHISKVKSISMDIWTSEQMEAIRSIGNVASNNIYNPRNVRPTLPMDPDMIDNAMEKYVRDKYQRRALAATTLATRDYTGSTTSTDDHPPPPPPKPATMFPPNIRASSATFPLSRREYALPRLPTEERLENSPSKSSLSRRESFNMKLNELKEMGFQDEKRNAAILRGLGSNLEKTVESLIRLGEGRSRYEQNSATVTDRSAAAIQTRHQPDSIARHGLPNGYRVASETQANPQPQSGTVTNSFNPFLGHVTTQNIPGMPLEQQVQVMNLDQVQSDLSTPSNWYDMNNATAHPSMFTPPISPAPYQYPATRSSTTHVLSHPELPRQSIPFASTNPFLGMTRTQLFPVDDIFGPNQPSPAPSSVVFNGPGQQGMPSHAPSPFAVGQSAFQYHQPQYQPTAQGQVPISNYYPKSRDQHYPVNVQPPQAVDQWPTHNGSQTYNPILTEAYASQQSSPARMDKDSILALFGQSSDSLQQSSIESPPEFRTDTITKATGLDSYRKPDFRQGQRSATMPVSMSGLASSSSKPNHNPFSSPVTASPATTIQPTALGHVRQESKDFSGPVMINGRHSPDAFADLSARFG